MKQIEEIVSIIKKHDLGTRHDLEYAPDIPISTLQNVAKNVDICAILTTMVAILDTTRMGKSCKSGLVFTLAGVYLTRIDAVLKTGDCPAGKAMKKPFYVKYADISEVLVGSMGVEVRLADGRGISIRSADILNREALADCFRELTAYDKTWDSGGFSRQTGLVEKKPLPANVRIKCHTIIHAASALAGGCGSGMAQVPCSDAILITPIQIGMIVALAAVFGFELSRDKAKNILAGLSVIGVTVIGRSLSQLLVGWIPGWGNALNATTAFALTECIGWLVAQAYYQLDEDNKARYALEGEKRGYVFASAEYEAKFRTQAALFLKQKENVEKMKMHYNRLLADCEEYIEQLEAHRDDLTDGDKKSLDKVKTQYSELKALRKSSEPRG